MPTPWSYLNFDNSWDLFITEIQFNDNWFHFLFSTLHFVQNCCFCDKNTEGDVLPVWRHWCQSGCGGGFCESLLLSITSTVPNSKCSTCLLKMRFIVEDYRSHKKRVTSNSFGIWFNLCLLEMEGGKQPSFLFLLSLLCFSNNHGLLERFSSLFLECHQTLPLLLKWVLLFGSWFLEKR